MAVATRQQTGSYTESEKHGKGTVLQKKIRDTGLRREPQSSESVVSVKTRSPSSLTRSSARTRKRQSCRVSKERRDSTLLQKRRGSLPTEQKSCEVVATSDSKEFCQKDNCQKDDESVQRHRTPEYFEVVRTGCNSGERNLELPENLEEKLFSTDQEVSSIQQKLVADISHAHFEKWLRILERFNILCYGFGSKQTVLDMFAERCREVGDTVVIHGYHPFLSVKEVLSKIERDVLKLKCEISQRKSMSEQFRNIERRLSDISRTSHSPFFLVVHNIDGPRLRDLETQEIMSCLASVPCIRLIASIDHLNAPLLWNRSIYARFRWYWEEVVTWESYMKEIANTSFLVNGEGDESRIKATLVLLNTLTKNARQIFIELAHILEENDNMASTCQKKKEQNVANEENGISFYSFYEHCRKQFLVSNPNNLKSILKELKDHEVISIRSSSASPETIKICLKRKQLETIISRLNTEE